MLGQIFSLPVAKSVKTPSVSNMTYRASDSADYKNKSQFEDIMRNKLDNNANVGSAVGPRKQQSTDIKENSDSSSYTKSQIERHDEQQSVKISDDSRTEKKETVCDYIDETEAEKTIEDDYSYAMAFADRIAQIMNMSLQDMVLLFKSAGVELSDTAGGIQTSEIVAKLSEMMQLNEEQTKYLAEMLDNVRALTSEVSAGQKGIRGQGRSYDNAVSVDNANISVVNQKESSDLSAIISEFRAKLQQMIRKYQHDQSYRNSENYQKIPEADALGAENSINPISLKGKEEKELNAGGEAAIENDADQDMAISDLKASEQKSGWNGNPNQNSESKGKSQNGYLETILKENMQETISPEDFNKMEVNNFSSGLAERIGLDAASVKAAEEPRITAGEILNQFIDKAEVALSGDKSEMVMNLKPDHLGKLSLKIVTENGIVMANFVADNQQVKEVLESNMQLLKDALEKQGLMVQGFSVSVGHGSEKRFEKKGFTGERIRVSNVRNAPAAGLMSNMMSMMNVTENLNPYQAGGSSIDLIA